MAKRTISIRLKITLLIAGALAASLLSYLFVGTSLIISDKVSYIYEYNLNQVATASNKVDTRIEKIIGTVALMGGLYQPQIQDSNRPLIESIYGKKIQELGILGLVLLTSSKTKNQFHLAMELGEGSREIEPLIVQNGWVPRILDESGLVISGDQDGRMAIAGFSLDAQSQRIYFVALIELDKGILETESGTVRFLYDSLGRPIYVGKQSAATVLNQQMSELAAQLMRQKFKSGVREILIDGTNYIASYQRFASDRLILISTLPKSLAFTAAKTLTERSTLLGVSILLLALGLTLLMVKKLTSRIRQMWFATQKVSEGDFSARVDLGSNPGNDEIGNLAISFNAMADKIDELMEQTATKARMEKELETAQNVQNRFFPSESLKGQPIQVAGASIPASECGGDWWNYSLIGDHVLVAIGDVTGHGIGAALVTAAVHGAFSIIENTYKSNPDNPPPLSWLCQHLNAAVYSSAKGGATMTFLVMLIDMKTGQMKLVNASHRPPYIYNPARSKGKGLKNIKPIMGAQCNALGQKPTIECQEESHQLYPGDMIFSYTDGLIECTNVKGEPMSKTDLLKMVMKHSRDAGENADATTQNIMKSGMDFFGDAATHLDDDITVVVSTVQNTTQFDKLAA